MGADCSTCYSNAEERKMEINESHPHSKRTSNMMIVPSPANRTGRASYTFPIDEKEAVSRR
jgi:hypothetical protein